jgi:cytochrome c nitrite reductase small subunit
MRTVVDHIKERLLRIPWGWQVGLSASLGAALGLAVLVARVSRATSYLSDSPETCMNCHVMTDAYVSWGRGSHGRVTVCNDCHVPHENLVSKMAFKALDGTKHSTVFTLRREPEVLRLSATARPVVQANCIRCHRDRLAMIRVAGASERACWQCHRGMHGEAHGLSASPEALRPQLPEAGVGWIKKGIRP